MSPSTRNRKSLLLGMAPACILAGGLMVLSSASSAADRGHTVAIGTPQSGTAPLGNTGTSPGPNPRAVSLYNLGLTAYKQGSPESAIIFFKRACDIDPNLADAQYNLAVIYQSQKRFRDAIPRYQEVLRIKPSDPDAHYQLGVILHDMGRYQEARQHFNSIAPNNVHFTDAQRRLAQMSAHTGGQQPAPTYGTTFQAPPAVQAPPAASDGHHPAPGSSPYEDRSQPGYRPQDRYTNAGGEGSSGAYRQPPQEAYGQGGRPPQYEQRSPEGSYTGGGTQAFYPQSATNTSRHPGERYDSEGRYLPSGQSHSVYTRPDGDREGQPGDSVSGQAQQSANDVEAGPRSGSSNPVPVLANASLRVIATGFSAPAGLSFDRAGNLYVANYMTNTIDRIAPDGTRSQFSSGVNLRGPIGLVVDDTGNVYVANYNSGTVARINPAGVSTVIATGFKRPYYLTLDRDGNLYVSQQEDNSIVRISLPRQQATANTQ